MTDSVQVTVPMFCVPHQSEAVNVLGMSPDDPWRAGIAVAQMLQFICANEFGDLPEGMRGDLPALVAAYPTCHACAFPEPWRKVKLVLFKGMAHAGRVLRRELQDPDCPLAPLTLPKES